MLKVLGGCPVPLIFLTLNADGEEFFTDKIREMTPQPDDSKGGENEEAISVMPDIRGGCSLSELVSNDLGSLEYRLIFVRWFGKSACFGFALGAVADEFKLSKNTVLQSELFEDLKAVVGRVRWNGVRITSKLLRNFDDIELFGFDDAETTEWRVVRIGAVFPKGIAPNSQWRRQDLRIVSESLEVVKE